MKVAIVKLLFIFVSKKMDSDLIIQRWKGYSIKTKKSILLAGCFTAND